MALDIDLGRARFPALADGSAHLDNAGGSLLQGNTLAEVDRLGDRPHHVPA